MRTDLIGWMLAAGFAGDQEVKRPERMKGAIGSDAPSRSVLEIADRPRLPGLMPDGRIVTEGQVRLRARHLNTRHLHP